MLVHVEISFGFECEIESAVARDQIEHVIEEADAGVYARATAAIEIDSNADVGFICLAMNRGDSRHYFFQ